MLIRNFELKEWRKNMAEKNKQKISIIALEDNSGLRSFGETSIKKIDIDADQLAINVNLFLAQMGSVVAKTPDEVGKFTLSEIEVSAEINGKGQVVLWGVGGEVGASGGIKFTFRKGEIPILAKKKIKINTKPTKRGSKSKSR